MQLEQSRQREVALSQQVEELLGMIKQGVASGKHGKFIGIDIRDKATNTDRKSKKDTN